ncbi:MAG: hypothetical protein MJ237_05055 [bacterium]|nr:hypothetical protein [bacterium]
MNLKLDDLGIRTANAIKRPEKGAQEDGKKAEQEQAVNVQKEAPKLEASAGEAIAAYNMAAVKLQKTEPNKNGRYNGDLAQKHKELESFYRLIKNGTITDPDDIRDKFATYHPDYLVNDLGIAFDPNDQDQWIAYKKLYREVEEYITNGGQLTSAHYALRSGAPAPNEKGVNNVKGTEKTVINKDGDDPMAKLEYWSKAVRLETSGIEGPDFWHERQNKTWDEYAPEVVNVNTPEYRSLYTEICNFLKEKVTLAEQGWA